MTVASILDDLGWCQSCISNQVQGDFMKLNRKGILVSLLGLFVLFGFQNCSDVSFQSTPGTLSVKGTGAGDVPAPATDDTIVDADSGDDDMDVADSDDGDVADDADEDGDDDGDGDSDDDIGPDMRRHSRGIGFTSEFCGWCGSG